MYLLPFCKQVSLMAPLLQGAPSATWPRERSAAAAGHPRVVLSILVSSVRPLLRCSRLERRLGWSILAVVFSDVLAENMPAHDQLGVANLSELLLPYAARSAINQTADGATLPELLLCYCWTPTRGALNIRLVCEAAPLLTQVGATPGLLHPCGGFLRRARQEHACARPADNLVFVAWRRASLSWFLSRRLVVV